ncbi:hypothetical protein LUZ60_008625 [Juncus effusus]|nr:hypothetical protein LUZ60_008625 [Juncus effusus]
MASLTLSSSSTPCLSRSKSLAHSTPKPLIFARRNLSFPSIKSRFVHSIKAGFSSSFFQDEGDNDYDFDEDMYDEDEIDFEPTGADAAAAFMEDKVEPPCPPGCRQYECMIILRPDVSEEKRLAFTQQYEELLVAGGAMYVEVFNRGILPLSYGIRKVNRDGTKDSYEEGIYMIFTFFTKPESIDVLENQLRADFNVIRHTTFKVEKTRKEKEEMEAASALAAAATAY